MEEPISSVTQPRGEVHRDKELRYPRQDRFIWIGFGLINRRSYRPTASIQSVHGGGVATEWTGRLSGCARFISVGATYRAAAFPVFAYRFLPSFRLDHALLATEARW